MNQPNDVDAARVDRLVRRFRDLRIGTRFRYLDGAAGGSVFVAIETFGYGLIAKWLGFNGTHDQVFCFADTEAEADIANVEIVE